MMKELTQVVGFRRSVRLTTATVVLFISVLVSWTPSLARAVGGYGISNASARVETRTNPEDGTSHEYLSVQYDVAWAGESFPGFHPCTIEVFDQDGSTLGKISVALADFTPEANGAGIDIPMSPSRDGEPSRVEATCSADRLDSKDGVYEVSNVSVSRAPETVGDLRTFQLKFDHRWNRASTSGVSACTLYAHNDSGDLVFAYDFNFSDSLDHRAGVEMRVITPNEILGEPNGGSVECHPLS